MDMSEMLNKLLSDPSAMAAAAEIAGKMLRNSDAQTTPAAAVSSTTNFAADAQNEHGGANSTERQNNSPPTDIFASVLNDPSFMEKMPQMMSAIAPLIRNMGQESSANIAHTAPPSTTSSAPHLPAPQTREKSEQEKRNALLLALKPYLSPERAEAVDQIIRLTELITLFSLFK